MSSNRRVTALQKRVSAWADSPEGKEVLGDVVKRIKQREAERRHERAMQAERMDEMMRRRINI